MSVIDEYLANIGHPQKDELERIRKIIKSTVPEADEVITYGMPGFKYKGKYLISFGSFKDHMSVFPGSAAIEETKSELVEYKLSRGTIQFTAEKQLPEAVVKRIVLIRLADISGN